jgi:hypothetical protein
MVWAVDEAKYAYGPRLTVLTTVKIEFYLRAVEL